MHIQHCFLGDCLSAGVEGRSSQLLLCWSWLLHGDPYSSSGQAAVGGGGRHEWPGFMCPSHAYAATYRYQLRVCSRGLVLVSVVWQSSVLNPAPLGISKHPSWGRVVWQSSGRPGPASINAAAPLEAGPSRHIKAPLLGLFVWQSLGRPGPASSSNAGAPFEPGPSRHFQAPLLGTCWYTFTRTPH